MQIILASASPRRRELLAKITENFIVVPATADEQLSGGESARAAARRLARLKAGSVAKDYPGALVIGSDTVVSLAGKILGKPADVRGAVQTLSELSGRTHSVITGVFVIAGGKSYCGESVSRVTFNRLSQEEIADYVDRFKPFDKAGAYGIQDGFPLVNRFEGSYENIVGLPLELTAELIGKAREQAENL